MKYLQLLKNKEVIVAIIALLAGVFAKELGLDAILSEWSATFIVGASLGVIGYVVKDTALGQKAEEVLRPQSAKFLKEVDKAIEKRYGVDVPDSIQGEILSLIWGDEADGY